MAVEEVNRQSELLGGLKIQMFEKAVGCDSSSASAWLSVLLEDGPVDAVIGPWCSLGCESSAYVTGGLDIAQISYSCTSPLLSDKDAFPTVTLPPDESGPSMSVMWVFVHL
jgi:ABC-type branched-subunit amino acid transport system substrate-binding protein